jgi:hypothetical protein
MGSMKSCPPGLVPRSQQRWLFAGLGMVFGAGLVQQLLFPVRPPLAELPPTLPLPNGWQPTGAPDEWAKAMAGSGPGWSREIRFGKSRRFSHASGGWVVITPIATWDLKSFDTERISPSLPGLRLQGAKILTLSAEQRQLAVGRLQSAPAYQSCLTPKGTLAAEQRLLEQFLRHPDPGLRTKALQSLVPSSNRGYACLLLTTNRLALLDQSAAACQFSTRLAQATLWPQ